MPPHLKSDMKGFEYKLAEAKGIRTQHSSYCVWMWCRLSGFRHRLSLQTCTSPQMHAVCYAHASRKVCTTTLPHARTYTIAATATQILHCHDNDDDDYDDHDNKDDDECDDFDYQDGCNHDDYDCSNDNIQYH